MDINTDQQLVSARISITNSKGDTAQVDGAPVWASSDPAVLTVTPSADGMTAVIDTVAPGTARVRITADSDLGAGVAEISVESDDIVVTAGPSTLASSILLDLGEPTAKP